MVKARARHRQPACGGGGGHSPACEDLLQPPPPPSSSSTTTTTPPGMTASAKRHAAAADRVPPTFMLAIALNQFYMSSTVIMPRTIAVYMVRRFLGPGKEARVAAQTGAMSSAFSLVQLAVSFWWGFSTDYLGRKPILLLSNVASGALVAGFALATDYRSALALRTAGGLFMCSGIVIKSTIGDECTARGQARAMAARALGLGAAQLVTPLVVGALADPCNLADSGGPDFGFKAGPACRVPGGWLVTFPYALAAAFIGCVGVVTTASNWWFLPTAVEMSAERVAARAAKRARLVAGVVAGVTCGRVTLAVPPAAAATPGPMKGRTAAAMPAVAEDGEAEESAATTTTTTTTADAARPPRPARPAIVVSPFAAVAAEATAAARPPVATEGREPGAAPPPAAADLRAAATAPAAVGRRRPTSDGDNTPLRPGTPTAAAAAAPTLTAPTPSSRLASAFAAASTRAARQGRALTTAPSLARARASTVAVLATAAMTMKDMGGGVGGPGGGELEDLNDAVEAAARFRLARAATLARVATAAGRPPPQSPPRPSLLLPPASEDADPEAAALVPPPPPWYRHRPALLAIVAYAISATVFCVVDELLPLYASAPVALHGLGLSTQQLSWAMSAAGVFLILAASFLYPPLQDRLGLAGVLSLGLVFGFFMCVPFYPLAYRVTYAAMQAGWTPRDVMIAVQAVLWVAGFLYAISYSCSNTSTQILVNVAAPDGAVGVVNGAGNALSALARVVAPILAAAMWGSASGEHSSLPLQWMPYLVAGSVFLLGWVGMKAACVTDAKMLGEE